MDIGSGKGWPQAALSNFAPHPFVFDGIECASMEGFLQSLKFDKEHIQVEVCKLVGIKAKNRGRKRNKAWKSVQALWWKGVPMSREGNELKRLVEMAFDELANNEGFRKAMIATGSATLTHSIGWSNPHETILTEREFCSNLTRVRENIAGHNIKWPSNKVIKEVLG